MPKGDLIYRLSDDIRPCLILSLTALAHMSSHRQLSPVAREAGGQLFALFIDDNINVVLATGPRTTDLRSRRFFHADRKAEQLEIEHMFKAGLHYVGDWHTHPENRPSPSATDVAAMKERFLLSKHQLRGIVMVIVGRETPPDGLYVGQHNGVSLRNLVPDFHQ